MRVVDEIIYTVHCMTRLEKQTMSQKQLAAERGAV